MRLIALCWEIKPLLLKSNNNTDFKSIKIYISFNFKVEKILSIHMKHPLRAFSSNG